MRTYLWVTLASLALLGCAENGTRKPTTSTNNNNSNTTTNDSTGRTTVSKPAIGGGETPATGNTSTGSASTTGPSANTNTNKTNATSDTPRPDNSAVNKRDQSENAVVPTDQGNNQKDLDISAEIRKRILRNDEMSIKGQNVKVITLGGKVTLRGPVASEAEKKTIEQIAQDVAGNKDNVTSELEVAPDSK